MALPFMNYTHYNTEDLTRIIERAEHFVASHTGGKAQLRERIQRIEFHEYSPSNPVETYRTWDGTTNGYKMHKRRKYTGHVTHARPERIPLLSPKLLWENPIEALAAADADGVERVPTEMLTRIGEEVLRAFDFDQWGLSRNHPDAKLDVTDMQLRLERTQAAKKDANAKKREQLRMALGAVNMAYYDAAAAVKYIVNYIDRMATAKSHDSDPMIAEYIEIAKAALSAMMSVREGGTDKIVPALKERRLALGDTSEVNDG